MKQKTYPHLNEIKPQLFINILQHTQILFNIQK